MKAKLAILIFISYLLVSCAPEISTRENEAIEVATEAPIAEAPMMQETVVIEEPVAREPPTETLTETPIACVTLLTPIKDAEIPPIGKVTFSWTPMDQAGNYVLNIMLPSGETVSFETDQTFRDRYMETFAAGGEYQWQIMVWGTDGSEICMSEVFTFDKPAYEKPKGGGSDGSDGNNGSGGPPVIPTDQSGG